MNIDDDILQDFLIEAGELFEQLGEQIVELEQQPDDTDLLNAIFRAFHTIKGGAGFLKVNEMVEVCHRAEDVFNVLRNGERVADAALIDVILQVIDVVGEMFEQLRAGEALSAAEPALLQQLEALAGAAEPPAAPAETQLAETQPATPTTTEPETTQAVATQADMQAGAQDAPVADNMDAEFEAMLRAAQKENPNEAAAATDNPAPASEAGGDDLITDEEFENLLDQLHGVGKHGGVPAPDTQPDTQPGTQPEVQKPEAEKNTAASESAAGEAGNAEENSQADTAASDLITDEEFEAVLDQMYGKNRGPGAPAAQPEAATDQAVAEQGAVADSAASADPAAQPKNEDAQASAAAASEVDTASEAANPVASPVTSPVTSSAKAVSKAASAPKRKTAESSVRVDTARLDHIMNLVGELVLVRNRLSTLKQIAHENRIVDAISNLELVTSDLQASVMKTRMQPIKKVFNRFPRVIRDLARKLNKDINLELVGEDTDLDKNLVEALADPLIHLVRNAVDHGIESPEERFANGKPREGTVTLAAMQEGDQILLTISDDGKGMDHELLRKKAVEKELMTEQAAARLTDTEAYNLIFAPGFSTKSEISDVSGRGVGMDVVKTRITELNGTLEIDSQKGQGTVITIRLPLTLAILPTLMVMLDRYQFALPLSNVIEAFNMEPQAIKQVDGQEVIRVRDRTLPLYSLYKWLVRDKLFEGPKPEHKVIVVQMGSQQFCLLVDHLIGQEEVVIKPLGCMIADTPGFAGATITGDGSIALVLDMPSLMKRYAA